jgi:hypothetical protein
VRQESRREEEAAIGWEDISNLDRLYLLCDTRCILPYWESCSYPEVWKIDDEEATW